MVLLVCAVTENDRTEKAAFPMLLKVSEGEPALTCSLKLCTRYMAW